MKVEQFILNTVVKTGREARLLIDSQLVKINNQIAISGQEVNSTDIVKVYSRKDGWKQINHPLI